MHRLFTPLLFASALLAQNDWTQPFPAHRVIDNVYYVGSAGLASYLITSPQGHILINSSLATSPTLIGKSVEDLGFRFADIKILLISHAHGDHCAGSQRIKAETDAQYMVMDADVPEIEDGGKSNFHYATNEDLLYAPMKVDRVLHDGDQVKLGGNVLTAHLTPGHTKGCTTWTWKAREGGKAYDVVVVGSPNVNPGYQLLKNAKYPNMAADYERTFRVLKSLKCDIFLGAHGDYYGMAAKVKRPGPNQFLDPEGYRAYVADREKAFRAELARQR
ncbi:MAG: subclass B3 metallo-beta-lactamase [Bryobacteraceae bacterium]|nr:subclass B3 metallo-beta-lactamase [Bryobacteraceae bacterium]